MNNIKLFFKSEIYVFIQCKTTNQNDSYLMYPSIRFAGGLFVCVDLIDPLKQRLRHILSGY